MNQQEPFSVGNRLRALRQERGLSLRDVAKGADVSASLLSQIESGKVNPSVASLLKIASALQLPINVFFSQSETEHIQSNVPGPRRARRRKTALPVTPDPTVRPEIRHVINLAGGVRWERLTATAEAGIEFLEVVFDEEASSGTDMLFHAGREFGYVLEGEAQLELGFEQYVLHPGDSVAFDATLPHRLTNRGQAPMRILWIRFNMRP
ncbi:MAG TPA: cupin domain-containing protein [Ktedonobacteraceae bacterium]|jgi:transcriptional regulator with XRE-family HTH domain